MKSWLSNWKRRRETDVAAELRASKPEASARFVKTLAARINPRPVQPVRTRTRLGLAAAVTATMVAVVGATGGFSSAASTIAGASHSVAHITHVSSSPSALVRNAKSGPVNHIGPRSADGQYAELPTITGFDPESGAPGATVTVSGTNFSGASSVTGVSLHGTPAAYNVSSNTSLTFTVPAGATSGVITVSNAKGSVPSSDTFTVIQTPQFSDENPFSPTEGGVGTPVTLSGSHFTGVTKVMIGGKSAPIFDSSSDTEIDTQVPVGAAAGSTTISVTNAAGTSTASGFNVISGAASISGFTPGSGQVGSAVKIQGKNLDVNGTPADVMFTGAANPADLTDGKTQSNTALWVNVPADATTGPITVSNATGSGTSSSKFIVLATPHITSVDPGFGIAGTPVVIKGDTFTGATAVIFHHNGGDDITLTGSKLAISPDTKITVKAPSTLTQGVTYSLEVTGKSGQTSSAAGSFYFEQKPAIDSLSPDNGAAGKQIAITPLAGNTFLGATGVKFGTTAATIVSNTPGEIDAIVPKGLVSGSTPQATVQVYVSNALGKSTGASFTVLNTAPTVSTLAPLSGQAGDLVTITGKNLNNNATNVTFLGGDDCIVGNGDLLSKSTGSGSKPLDTITFDVPDCARTGALQVANADGSVNTASFKVFLKPVVEGFQPAYGISGTSVKVVGAPGTFVGAYEVDFGAAAAKTGIVVAKDGASLTVVVPKNAGANLAAGNYQVTVKVDKSEPLAGNSGNLGFTIVAKPANLQFTDQGGTGGTGHSFTLTGSNLLGITKVKFGTVSAVFQQVVTGEAVDPTQLTVYVPAGATSSTIKVTNAAGSATTAAIYPVLAIKSLSPTTSRAGKANVTLTITGSGFKFGGSLATVSIGSDSGLQTLAGSNNTHLLVKIPTDLAAGDQTVDVTNALGDVQATLKLHS